MASSTHYNTTYTYVNLQRLRFNLWDVTGLTFFRSSQDRHSNCTPFAPIPHQAGDGVLAERFPALLGDAEVVLKHVIASQAWDCDSVGEVGEHVLNINWRTCWEPPYEAASLFPLATTVSPSQLAPRLSTHAVANTLLRYWRKERHTKAERTEAERCQSPGQNANSDVASFSRFFQCSALVL